MWHQVPTHRTPTFCALRSHQLAWDPRKAPVTLKVAHRFMRRTRHRLKCCHKTRRKKSPRTPRDTNCTASACRPCLHLANYKAGPQSRQECHWSTRRSFSQHKVSWQVLFFLNANLKFVKFWISAYLLNEVPNTTGAALLPRLFNLHTAR